MNMISSKLDKTGWRWFRQFVEKIPIPDISFESRRFFSEIVQSALKEKLLGHDTTQQERQLDNLIFSLFEMSEQEIKYLQQDYDPQ